MVIKFNFPCVSILTPTKNRYKIFENAILNIFRQDYPKDKIEWVIIEDGNNCIEPLLKSLSNQIKIKYIKLENDIPLSQKRNLCVKYATNKILVHMDDDDYYSPQSVSYRVISLLENKKIGLVGCNAMLLYDIESKTFLKWNPKDYPKHTFKEATFCFTKNFWKMGKFKNNKNKAEGRDFIFGKENMIKEVDISQIMCCIIHNTNTVDKRKSLHRFEKIDIESIKTLKIEDEIRKIENLFQ